MNTLQSTIERIDADAAALKARLVAEQERHNREIAEIAQQTALQQERDEQAAQQRAQWEAFEDGPLANAQSKFAELHERAKQLRAMVAEAETLHETIATGAADLAKDAQAATQALVAALPELTEHAADEALQRVGVGGLRFHLPRWLLSIHPNRWLGNGPGVSDSELYMTGHQYVAQLVRERQRAKAKR